MGRDSTLLSINIYLLYGAKTERAERAESAWEEINPCKNSKFKLLWVEKKEKCAGRPTDLRTCRHGRLYAVFRKERIYRNTMFYVLYVFL